MLDAVNRTNPRLGDKVVVFGAGPIGLGAVLGYRRRGVANIVVVDIIPSRLEKALQVGADAVINSAEEDVAARLVELHGDGATARVRGVRSATDIIENWERYALIVSHVLPFDQALEALDLAKTPGAADKVVVVFGEA